MSRDERNVNQYLRKQERNQFVPSHTMRAWERLQNELQQLRSDNASLRNRVNASEPYHATGQPVPYKAPYWL